MENPILFNVEIPEEGNKEYRVIHIFVVDASGRQYCSLVEENNEESEITFLRCDITEDENEEQIISVSIIPTEDEYELVAGAYSQWLMEALREDVVESVKDEPDYLTVKGADGKDIHLIAHAIFDDETTGRTYIAVQEIKDNGQIEEEISLYRFIEGEPCRIDMIYSDMEYDRVKKILEKLVNPT